MADETQLQQEDESLDLLISSTAEPPVSVKKVELDLDDAPFLQADEKSPVVSTHEAVVPEASEDEARAKARKKKLLLILAGGALGVLALVMAAVWWFFFRTPPLPPPEGLKPEVVVVPRAQAPVGNQEIVREFAPFVVPVRNADGKENFLVCKFSAILKDPAVNREMDSQRIALRDAIYFYLRSKDNPFLLDARNAPQIKKDLLAVFNDYLTQGKLEDILFESYLSQ